MLCGGESMLKIFLVEDEKIVREGIKNGIAWEKHGLEFVGEASDGELAYPLIVQEKPDILITDIRMPFMDGLELAEMVKHELPEIRIMFFSGYDDFEYAKRAIKLGAFDYLLKPVSSTQLLEALERMSNSIQKERRENLYKQEFYKQQNERKTIERERLFDVIVSGTMSVADLITKGKEFDLALSAPAYNIILFHVRARKDLNTSINFDVFELQVKEKLKEHSNMICFHRLSEGYGFLITGTGDADVARNVKECTSILTDIVDEFDSVEYFGGIGKTVFRPSELKECFIAASKSYAYRYMVDYNQIITEDSAVQIPKQESLNIKSMDVAKWNKDMVNNFLKNGSTVDANYFVEKYISLCGDNMKSQMFRQYILMDFYLTVMNFVTQYGVDSEQAIDLFGDANEIQSCVAAHHLAIRYIEAMLIKAIELRNTFSQKKYRFLLEKAKEYIEKHYQDEDISLNTVAACVNISPNHFSTIFSQELGITFIEYLTMVRMDAAKEYLSGSEKRTSEIAYLVGYKDPHYFSYLFKKTQGITPKTVLSVDK